MAENLYYMDEGSGIPVVLLHGYPFDHTIWKEVSRELSNQAHVILPDLRGHGRSPKPAQGYTIADMASDVKSLLDEIQVSSAVLIGHSMGGYVALSFAHQYPEKLLGLGLVASHGYADSIEKKQSRIKTIDSIRNLGTAAALALMPDSLTRSPVVRKVCREFIENADSEGMVGVISAIAHRPDTMAVLNALRCPIMVLAGKNDEIIPIGTSRLMVSDIDDVNFIEVEEAGHMPMLEKPEVVADSIISLIDSIEKG